VEKTLNGLVRAFQFGHSEPGSLSGHALPHDEGLAIGAQAREQGVVEQIMAAATNICGALFTPRSAA